jgi:hypothetical protein
MTSEDLRTEGAWSDLEESAQVVNEIIKDSIIIDDLFDERTLLNQVIQKPKGSYATFSARPPLCSVRV